MIIDILKDLQMNQENAPEVLVNVTSCLEIAELRKPVTYSVYSKYSKDIDLKKNSELSVAFVLPKIINKLDLPEEFRELVNKIK